MSKQTSLFLKIFLPLLAVVAAVHICIFHALGRRSDQPSEVSEKTIPNADLSKLPTPEKTPVPAADPSASVAVAVDAGPAFTTPALPYYDFSSLKRIPADLQKLSRPGKSGIIVDLSTRKVLWAKNPTAPVPIASLTKLMTALLLMEDISSGRLEMTTKLPVTAAATEVERSCVLGMKRGEVYTVEELLAAMMINSHNDAAAQIAACVAGNVKDFVTRMNTRARELGLSSAAFNSPNGLPQGKQRLNSLCSVTDVTRLSEYLMRYPQLLKFCQMKNKKLHTGKVVYSHNNLLRRRPVPGLFGFKTGYTTKAGFCLSFGVTRKGRRIIGCVAGFPSARDRDEFCRRLIDWAYSTQR